MDGDGRPLAWAAQSAIYHGASPTGVGFDPQEERVWVTDTDGFLTSYTLGDQQLYSATRVAWFSSQDDANWAITSSRAEQIRPIVSARCGPRVVGWHMCVAVFADVNCR